MVVSITPGSLKVGLKGQPLPLLEGALPDKVRGRRPTVLLQLQTLALTLTLTLTPAGARGRELLEHRVEQDHHHRAGESAADVVEKRGRGAGYGLVRD